MKLSILIPVYNAEKYLNECLSSVLNTSNDIEVIAIDDGSTDGSLNILKKHNIKVVSRENKGICYTRKELAHMATGEYVFYVDADDYIEENGIDTIFSMLQQSNYPDILIFGAYYEDGIIKQYLDENKLTQKDLDSVQLDFSLYKLKSALWTKVFKRVLIEDIEFTEKDREITTAEDLYVTAVAMNKAKTIYYAHEAIYNYRKINPESITRGISYKDFHSVNLVFHFIKNDYKYFNSNKKNWYARYINSVKSNYIKLSRFYYDIDKDILHKIIEELRKDTFFIEASRYKSNFIVWLIKHGLGVLGLKIGYQMRKIAK